MGDEGLIGFIVGVIFCIILFSVLSLTIWNAGWATNFCQEKEMVYDSDGTIGTWGSITCFDETTGTEYEYGALWHDNSKPNQPTKIVVDCDSDPGCGPESGGFVNLDNIDPQIAEDLRERRFDVNYNPTDSERCGS